MLEIHLEERDDLKAYLVQNHCFIYDKIGLERRNNLDEVTTSNK